MNNNVRITTHHIQLSSENAKQIISNYNVIIDATDNVATRYLLNDTCVLENKPLVSGSALQWEGQMTVYNYNNGPCYRCLFQIPPSPETVINCGDGGVVGPGKIICNINYNKKVNLVLKMKSGPLAAYAR